MNAEEKEINEWIWKKNKCMNISMQLPTDWIIIYLHSILITLNADNMKNIIYNRNAFVVKWICFEYSHVEQNSLPFQTIWILDRVNKKNNKKYNFAFIYRFVNCILNTFYIWAKMNCQH